MQKYIKNFYKLSESNAPFFETDFYFISEASVLHSEHRPIQFQHQQDDEYSDRLYVVFSGFTISTTILNNSFSHLHVNHF